MSEWNDNKYLVIPTKYLKRLPSDMKTQLTHISHKVLDMRESEGAPPAPKYCVIKQSEPYFDKVKEMILEGDK